MKIKALLRKIFGLPPASLRRCVRIPIGNMAGDFMTFSGLVDGREHLAIGLGRWKKNSVPLVRIHSECLTGDVFFSGKCDCGEQLKESLQKIHQQGGILLYLRQEGRGIGLYNKLDAYALQARGLDTYEANRQLGLKDDLRSYEVAAQMLKTLNIQSIQLLTNNPDKAQQLENLGIHVVKAISTGIFLKVSNRKYLEAKVKVTHHHIELANAHI